MRAKASQPVLFLVAMAIAFAGPQWSLAAAAKPTSRKPPQPAAAKAKDKPRRREAAASERDARPHRHNEIKRSEHSISRREERKAVPPPDPPTPILRHEPDEELLKARHDRKQHFSAEPATPETGVPAKPATSDPSTALAKDEAAAEPPLARHKAARAVAAVPATVPEPAAVVSVAYNKRGQLIVPPALKGSHEILLRQNEVADREGLSRIQDDGDLARLREDKLLVPIPAVSGLQPDERLAMNRRYCRPWTARFLVDLARAYYGRFHSALQVTSAVRTVKVQEKLLITNGNAAPAEGATASPHLTGQAVDLAKHGLSLTEIAWLREYLLPLIQAGKVDVEEEFQQACFHISVYRKYARQTAPGAASGLVYPRTGLSVARAHLSR